MKTFAMHKRISLTVIATLASVTLTAAGASSRAEARMIGGASLLNVCNANWSACIASCYDPNDPFPPTSFTCEAVCWDKHAACVDLAFSLAR
jgi:hypothetical protein